MDDFDGFVIQTWPDSLPGQHFNALTAIFHRIDAGEEVRAIVLMPPRFGCSERVSYLFPAWFLSKHQGKKVIIASESKALSWMFQSKIVHLIEGDANGRVHATGVGSALMGHSADLIIVDSPHRYGDTGLDFNKAYNWFLNLRCKLRPGGSMLIAMHRQDDADLAGRLLSSGNEKWDTVSIPALTDSGESAWPQRWSVKELKKLKVSIPIATFNALYQQQVGGAT